MRNRTMIRFSSKVFALGMSVVMAAGAVTLPASAAKKSKIDNDKTETVYVNADPDGNVEKVTVSNWLRNSSGDDDLDDYTILNDVKNVKGDEEYTKNPDGTITWHTGGKDIYYQGETSQHLPVTVKVSYFLDGRKMSAKEIAGKSGKVRIRFDYSNNSYERVKVKGKEYTIHTPFSAVTALILDSDYFTNVEVENGRVINDGTRNIVIGMALPGLEDSLKLTSLDMFDEINIPDFVEVTADASDFQLSLTATAVSNGLLSEMDTKNLKDVDDLKEGIDDLVEASTKLVDGSGELSEGLQTLADSLGEYSDGMDKAVDGSDTLSKGLKKLDAGSLKLEEGGDTLNKGLKTLKKGTRKLDEGIGKYGKGMGQLDDGIETASDGLETLLTGANTLKKGVISYTDSEKQIYGNMVKLNESVTAMAGNLPSPEDFTSLVTALSNLNSHAANLTKAQKSFKESVETLLGFARAIQELGSSLQDTAAKGTAVKQDLKGAAEKAAVEAAKETAADAANKKIQDANKQLGEMEKTANDAMKVNAETANGQIHAIKDKVGAIKTAAINEANKAAKEAAKSAVNEEVRKKAADAASDAARKAAAKAAQDAADEAAADAAQTASEKATNALNNKKENVLDALGEQVDDETRRKVEEILDGNIDISVDTPEVNVDEVSVSKDDISVEFGDVTAEVDTETIDAAAGDALNTSDVSAGSVEKKELAEVTADDFKDLAVSINDPDLGTGINAFQTSIANTLKKMQELPSVDEESLAGLKDMTDALTTLQADLLALKESSGGLSSSMEVLRSAKGNFDLLAKSINTLTTYMGKLNENNDTLQKGVSTAVEGIDALKTGMKKLDQGSDKLLTSAAELKKGSSAVDKGTEKLVTGSDTLSSGLITFGNGIEVASKGGKDLTEGLEKLQNATGEVTNGVDKLNNGADKLADGMREFDEQGISELAEKADDDFVDVANRLRAIKKADKSYDSYSGKADNKKSSVKFIIETDEVGGDEE